MKLARRVLLGLVAVLAAVILTRAVYSASVRRADANYHARLAKTLRITSDSFEPDGDIPSAFKCRGAGKSPDVE
jgi:hypothetical protein